MSRAKRQNGFILMPVVIAIVLIATIAFMLNNQSTINVRQTGGLLQAEQAEQVAQAGLAHAIWDVQNTGCIGDMTIPSVAFGAGSYSATVESAATTTSQYNINPDRDTWIHEASPDENNAGDDPLSVKNKPGDNYNALYHFDLSSIPNDKQVVTATAWFYVDQADSQGAVTLHPVTAAWIETDATWNTIGSNFESGVYATIPPQPASGVWVSVNVTALAQAWVNNPGANHGILLSATVSDLESRFTSKEASASQRPYLAVTTADASVSPVQISATGTLTGNPSPANDITRTLTRNAVSAHQPATTLSLQPGAEGKDAFLITGSKSDRNTGSGKQLWLSNGGSAHNALVEFNLSNLPPGARVLSATLDLYNNGTDAATDGVLSVHRITRSWVEGSGVQTGTWPADGVSWDAYDGVNAWTTPGGDYDPQEIASAPVPDLSARWYTFDVSSLVTDWLNGTHFNHGVLVRASGGSVTKLHFVTGDDNLNPDQHPKLTITYACECGSPCLAPQGAGNILMVVSDEYWMTPGEQRKQALFESWGYTVNLISQWDVSWNFDTLAVNNDVVYVSEGIDHTTWGMAPRLVATTLGVVNEEGMLNDALGISNNAGVTVGSTLNVTDTSHYITAPFPTGPLEIYAADMEQQVVFNGPAPDLQTLAEVSGYSALVTLETGASLKGGGTAAGRRAMLPLGREAKFNWDYVNNNGRLLVQRTLQWGTGNIGTAPTQTLLFVAAGTSPTAQEQLRIDLIESWGYEVNVIDDNDSQANFDAAVAANDVAYISSTVKDGTLGTKLTSAPIGVVNEKGELTEELGFGQSGSYKDRTEIDVVDNTHYITQTFSNGLLTIVSSSQSVPLITGTIAPAFQLLTQTANVGYGFGKSMGAIETGGQLYGGGTAEGRRVLLPWGASGFDFNALNADGRTLMQRAIEWAEGAGSSTPQNLLLVVVDQGSLTAQEAAKKTLIESWGYTVALIDEADSQASYDTALAANDVVYITEDVVSNTLGTKLVNATIGVVTEEDNLSDEFGLSDSIHWGSGTVLKIEGTHYITETLPPGNLTIFTATESLADLTGNLAPALQIHGVSTSGPALASVEAGADVIAGRTAVGRRVQLPWGGDSFDVNHLNADGMTLMKRAIEWGAGAVTTPLPNLLLVVDNSGSLALQDSDKKTLIESWGYAVTIIDDNAIQSEFDAAVLAAAAAYVSATVSDTTLGSKLVNAGIGVVNEKANLVDEFGFSTSRAGANRTQIEVMDNGHYITSGFSMGSLTIHTSSQPNYTLTGTLAAGLGVLANGESSSDPGLAVMDAGAGLAGGGTAAGRRVKLPWGGAAFDLSFLNADGRTIMQRAIEWAAGTGGGGGGGGGGSGPVFEEFTEAALGSNGSSLVIAKPPGTAAGDLLVAAVATDGNNSGSLAPPAGWNVIHVANQNGKVTFGVWWKLAGASEPGSYPFTWSSSERAYGWIMRFTGHDPGSPILVDSNAADKSAAPSSPSVTTTVDNALILRLGGFDDDDITAGDPGLSGHTAINMGKSDSGNFSASGGSGYILQASAGASGTSEFSMTGSEEYVTVTVAINPAP